MTEMTAAHAIGLTVAFLVFATATFFFLSWVNNVTQRLADRLQARTDHREAPIRVKAIVEKPLELERGSD